MKGNGTTMSEQALALAQRFEQTNDEAIRVVDGCGEDEWRAHHAAENRTVNVLAHHIAIGHQAIVGWVQSRIFGG